MKIVFLFLALAASCCAQTITWSTEQPHYFEDLKVIQTVTRKVLTLDEILDLLDQLPTVKYVRVDAPRKMQFDLNTLCFPQYADDFSLSETQWKEIQDRCRKLILESSGAVHPDVLKHWLSIVEGKPPFGLRVSKTKK